jgi:hypothetical protein
MSGTFLRIVRVTVLVALAAVLVLFAVLVVPVYTAFMVIWFHVPLTQVLAVTGPAAVVSIVAAVGIAALARRKQQAPQ